MKRKIFSASILSLALAVPAMSGAASGQDAESALANADTYTVVVKTIIRQPFGDDGKGNSVGAGFVIDRQRGWILTNAHVASRSQAIITAKFRGGEPIDAKRVYVDPFLDLAILSIKPEMLPAEAQEAKLDCGALPKAGIPVVAYGHPGGLYFTGTKGIISGVSAKYETELLQTDAPINRGNSGGPLINLSSGRIAGISTASVSGMQNTNFALASRFVCPIVTLLREGKDPSPPRTDWAFFSGIEESSILKVAKAGRFGERFGIQPGDIIVSVNGSAKPTNQTQLLHEMRGRLSSLQVDVERAGTRLRLYGDAMPEQSVLDRQGVMASGMLLTEFDERVTRDIPLHRVLVQNIERGSPADNADISASTMLVSVNGTPTPTLDAAYEALSSLGESEKAAVLVFKRIDDSNISRGNLYDWRERKLVVSDVKRIRVGDAD